MNNLFKENARIFSLLLVLLFVLLIVVYFVFVNPQSKQLKAAKQNVSNLESEIAALEASRNQSKDSLDSDTLLLEKKVPITPELEDLLLTFQEIELVSGSRIENIEFSYDGELPEKNTGSEESQDNQSNENSENANDANKTNENNENGDSQPADTSESSKPEFLKAITAKMDVLSPDYDSFQEFLQELEKRERIMRVDKLTFEKPAEKEQLEGSGETITFTIEATTFYYKQ